MKHLGDISKIHGAQIEPVDLITFGSPCQDLSVAGKRAGLKHETNGDQETTRSGLFMEAVRIIKEMREATDGKYPRFALWENVPGAFSSNKGEDFRIVLEEIAKISEADAIMPEVPKAGWAYADCFSGNGWSMAYRVLDAQHWGVPQRRRRIFLVADFAGERAEEILFEREGLRGDFASGGTPWQEAAAHAESSTGTENIQGARCSNGAGGQVAACLYAAYGTKWNGNSGAYSGENFVLTEAPTCYGISSYASNAMLSDNPHSGIYEASTSRTLDLNGGNPACNQGGIAVVEPVDISERLIETPAPELTARFDSDGKLICMATQQGGAEIRDDDKAPTITAAAGMSGNNQPVIAFAQNQRDEIRDLGDKAGSLQAQPGMKQQTFIIDSVGGQAESAKETEISPTLKAVHYKSPPVFAGGFCPEMSAKTRSVGYQEEMSPTLRAGVTPACTYGFQRQLSGVEAQPEISPTILAAAGESGNNQPCVVTATDIGFFNSMENASPSLLARGYKDPHLISHPSLASGNDVTGCLMASGYDKLGAQEMFSGDYTVVEPQYIVRRLTPTECARLQGFADNWGQIDEKESFTEEEYRFWLEVRNTHAAINGKQVKDYTEKQMLTWYNKLHTDSAEYKMWGNGIALPPALYVMQGIAEAIEEAKKTA